MSGLLIAGRTVPVVGLAIINSFGAHWCRLDPGDYRARRARRPHLIIDHTTGGRWPQRVLPGAGPRGHAERIANMWAGKDRRGGERVHSGAQILIDYDGLVACLCDLVYCAAYHAEMANDVSIGIEHCTTPDGSIYEATLEASAILHRALCEPDDLEAGLNIPFQVHAATYRGAPLARCETGRKTKERDGRVQSRCDDLYGIIQHRDQTSERGRGDAGDELVTTLLAAGAEGIDFSKAQDLDLGRKRQRWLNAADSRAGNTVRPLVVDGLVGPGSLAAARRQGFARWRDVPTS